MSQQQARNRMAVAKPKPRALKLTPAVYHSSFIVRPLPQMPAWEVGGQVA